MVIIFKNKGSRTSARHKSVTVFVKRPACPGRVLHVFRKCSDGIERSHGVEIGFLSSSAKNHVLQSVLDQHIGKSDGVASAGTGGADCEVHSLEPEYRTDIHCYGRVHCLEYERLAEKLGIMFLIHNLGSLDYRLGG